MTTVDVFIYDWDVKCNQTGSMYIQFEINDTVDLSSDRPFLIPASISLPTSLLRNWIGMIIHGKIAHLTIGMYESWHCEGMQY